ncbi:rCG30131, partial [Rattus norvegicus]
MSIPGEDSPWLWRAAAVFEFYGYRSQKDLETSKAVVQLWEHSAGLWKDGHCKAPRLLTALRNLLSTGRLMQWTCLSDWLVTVMSWIVRLQILIPVLNTVYAFAHDFRADKGRKVEFLRIQALLLGISVVKVLKSLHSDNSTLEKPSQRNKGSY